MKIKPRSNLLKMMKTFFPTLYFDNKFSQISPQLLFDECLPVFSSPPGLSGQDPTTAKRPLKELQTAVLFIHCHYPCCPVCAMRSPLILSICISMSLHFFLWGRKEAGSSQLLLWVGKAHKRYALWETTVRGSNHRVRLRTNIFW